MSETKSIADIVPHDPPMVLLDRLVSSNETSLVAEVNITGTTPFFEPNYGVPAYVGVEYIAQAISAHNGLKDTQKGQEVKPGFLLGSRKIELNCPYFKEGQTLIVSVKVSFNDGEMAVFDGEILLEKEVIVSARINAFQPENPFDYIETVKQQHV
ncbi:hypothetical protein A9Q83_02195 [Alphaproteobacteria bacterium 46_93_T64]|nr:hypothetical protein A9Q83_02195 [Alphaproteobacteria bacterium 46_93_T64]